MQLRRHRDTTTFSLVLTMAVGLIFTAAGERTAKAQTDPLKDVPRVNLLEFNRKAVTNSLPLLQNSAATFRAKIGGTCYSCHHQTLPSMAVALARKHGFTVDEKRAKEETGLVHGLFAVLSPLAVKSLTDPAAEKDLDMILVDPSISIGYALYGLAAEEVKPDVATEAMTRYLMRKQEPDGRWPVWTARQPLEASEFTATALAVHALQVYAPKNQAVEAARRIAQARTWLLTTKPKTTEDKVFRLYGLRRVNAESPAIQTAVNDLLALQNDDGGWAQLPTMPSDAYATGQVLVALNQAGSLPTASAVYRRGAFYLAARQQKDGSWLVAKRAMPVQPFFDTGFPHDQAQYISCAGSCWATMALALTLPVPDGIHTASAGK